MICPRPKTGQRQEVEGERGEKGKWAVNCLANGAHYAPRKMSKLLKFNIKLEKAKKKEFILPISVIIKVTADSL